MACYTLRDIRKGVSTEYPIVKIGAQYWMGKELHATTYRDGAPLKNRVTWEQTKPDITSRTNMTFILQWRIHTGRRAGSRGLENSIGCRLGTAENYTGNDASILKQENGRQWYPVKLPRQQPYPVQCFPGRNVVQQRTQQPQ